MASQTRSGRLVVLLVASSFFAFAAAEHAWENYHWARTSNPFQVKVVNSMGNKFWDDRLRKVNQDWNQAPELDGGITTEWGPWTKAERELCAPVEGKVRACNANYGDNGWHGLSTLFLMGDHITACTAQFNDFYKLTSEVDKLHVLCQEVGHCWGLGHQSTDGTDFNTCMDYAEGLDNAHPDEHDFEMLEAIYTHKDDTNTAAVSRKLLGSNGSSKSKCKEQAKAATIGDTSQFGELLEDNERESYWEKRLPDGTRVITHALKVGALKNKAVKPVVTLNKAQTSPV